MNVCSKDGVFDMLEYTLTIDGGRRAIHGGLGF
jgi:hypothetical protein